MDAEAFVQWAMDDARTIEERYCVELLIERCYGRWKILHNVALQPHDWDALYEHKRQRKLNPAYEPHYTEEVVRRITEVFPEVTQWSAPHTYDERPLRDLKALRFLPALVDLTLGQVEVTDLSPLLEMAPLRKLCLGSAVCEDFALLGQCRQLRELHLSLGVPWPEVAGLEALTQLEVLHLSGNLLVFERGTTFPHVVRGILSCTPLAARNVRDLPQLPACQFLTLSGVERLDGIEAFARLRNLTLQSDVRDYAPLAALTELTCLTCTSPKPLEVSPLARVPKLAFAAFLHDYRWGTNHAVARDYAPLAESPSLRELSVPHCPPVTTEVAALNAALPPWDECFARPEPQPLPPLRIISAPYHKLPPRPDLHLMPGEPEPMDEGLRRCEASWIAKQIERAVTQRLGSADWGKTETQDHLSAARAVSLRIQSFAVVEKLGEIVEATREALARSQPDYFVSLYVDLKAPLLPPSAAQRELQERFDREQEQFEHEKRQRENADYLDRLHRFQLKKQEGGAVKPEEFAAPAPVPPPPPPWEREDAESDDPGDDGDGDVAVKHVPDPPPSWFDDQHPLADNYRMWGEITLSEVWLSGDAGLVSYTMGRAPDVVIERDRR